LSLKLIQVCVGGQQRILHCILSISMVAQMSQRYGTKEIQPMDDYISEFLDLVFKGPEQCPRAIHTCCSCGHK